MENQNNDNKPKVTDSEGYNIEKPQNETLPTYNSTTSHRESSSLPAVENLNHTEGLKDELKAAKKDNSAPSVPKNDGSLFGESRKTDLGNGQRDEDEDQKERIIRQ